MTLNDVIQQIDQTHPSSFSYEQKVAWLSELDTRAYAVMSRHQMELPEFHGYTEEDGGKDLLINTPYDDVYAEYLEMKISLGDRDYAYYNNAATLFSGMWNEWTSFINRSYRPVDKIKLFNFKGERNV